MNAPKARAPRGIPAGGQFITEPKMESGIVDPDQHARYTRQLGMYTSVVVTRGSASIGPTGQIVFDTETDGLCTLPSPTGPDQPADQMSSLMAESDLLEIVGMDAYVGANGLCPEQHTAGEWDGPYTGNMPTSTPEGLRWVRRVGDRVRYYDMDGAQVGDEQDSPEAIAPDVNWGSPYPQSVSYNTPDGPVWMRRRGQRVRYYNAAGDQVGPEHSNVAPAVGYAQQQGWLNPHLYS